MEKITDRQGLWRWRQRVGCVGFVPTMGALHEGHLSLVQAARARTEHVIASIFVNPTQFGPNEDFTRYPRTLEQDQELLAQAGCTALFCPPVTEIYAGENRTVVRVEPLGSDLCGRVRPTHFQGVATVVAVLLNLVRPDQLFLGWKDYQQVILLRKMVHDLALPVEVVGVPTVREVDGLALSSRNRYLGPEDRRRAVALHQALTAAHAAWRGGERRIGVLVACARRVLESFGVREIDYVEVRDADTLEPLATGGEWEGQGDPVLLIAARVGAARLIDNRILSSA